MRFLLALALVAMMASFSEAALAHERNAQDKDDSDMCYSKKYEQKMKMDEDYPIKDGCGKMRCDSTYTITYFGCGKVALSKELENKCKIEENLDLPYPECCPTVKCA